MKKIYLYKKYDEDEGIILATAKAISSDDDEMFSVTENKRSFREFDTVLGSVSTSPDCTVIVLVKSLSSLGLSMAEIRERLEQCKKSSIILVCCTIKASYEYGIRADINKAVLGTLLYMVNTSIEQNANILKLTSVQGRPSYDYPDGWEMKYRQWNDGKITSGEFIKWSGLKRATFYNKLTEYQEQLTENTRFYNEVKAL